jgi:hypothetical protein
MKALVGSRLVKRRAGPAGNMKKALRFGFPESFVSCNIAKLEALRRRERAMNNTAVLAASGLFLLTTLSESVIAAEQQFTCKGQMIEPTGEQTAPLDLKLNLGGPGKTTIELGGGKLNVSVTSDNKIQLKFQTKQYVGEFFHYTNDLYLIYKSGHLARLSCSKN